MDWVPFVLEDAKHALTRWSGTQDRGMWVAGFYSGAAQSLIMGGEPEAFLDGYACGSVARGNADKNRSRISEVRAAAARARWDREQPKQIVMDANACAVEDANAYAVEDANAYAVEDANAYAVEDAPAMHKTDIQDKTQQSKNNQKNKPHHTSIPAAVSTPLSAVTPRASAPAAPAWGPEQALAIRQERWSSRRQEWLAGFGEPVDFTKQPSLLAFLSYCRAVHPSWQSKFAKTEYDTWAAYNWTHGGKRIGSWWRLADAFAGGADQTEHFDAFMDGSKAKGLDLSSMSAKAAGITSGERL
jgi:hypothetical protein